MISPNNIKVLSTFGPKAIARALDSNGYSGHSFEDAEFLGINEDGHFVYKVTFYDEAGLGDDELLATNVYLIYDFDADSYKAEF
jgi:hypothetical protein